jgi:hypothetical protein
VGVASARGASTFEFRFHGDRWSNRRLAASAALRLLLDEARAAGRAPVKTA